MKRAIFVLAMSVGATVLVAGPASAAGGTGYHCTYNGPTETCVGGTGGNNGIYSGGTGGHSTFDPTTGTGTSQYGDGGNLHGVFTGGGGFSCTSLDWNTTCHGGSSL